MTGRGSRAGAAGLLCAVGLAAFVASPAAGQTAPVQQAPPASSGPELDPNAPLAPMPDLGVDWPDLNAKEAEPPVPPPPQATAPAPKKAATTASTDGAGNLRYTTEVEGLSSIGSAEDILK